MVINLYVKTGEKNCCIIFGFHGYLHLDIHGWSMGKGLFKLITTQNQMEFDRRKNSKLS